MNDLHPEHRHIARKRAAAVKDLAAALGFDACGIADVSPIDPENRFDAWLAQGYHADMAWMTRTAETRRDISRWLPGARSVIVVARNYYQSAPLIGQNTALIARYAWGRDYHRVMKKPLERLGGFIAAIEPGAACRICIDSGPVLERAWAAKSGVGWIGKNSLVLRRDLGSWFFLGLVATTIALVPDPPAKSYCGACTACIDACPAQAIVAPGVVDARRCIAYHTIENRGEIPASIQHAMGMWVFGCDLCQEACPWNRGAHPSSEPAFALRPGVAEPALELLATMDDAAFVARFQGTSVMRAKSGGMRRNARIALRNRSRQK